MWFVKGVKELQGEAGDAVYFQTGIYTPLILSMAGQPEWHDMNVVTKAAANSHHLCSSPRTCKGNVWIPGLLLHSLCHQKRYLVSEKAGRHGAEMADGSSWEGEDNSVSALQIIQSFLSLGCIPLLLSLLLNISPKHHHLRNTEFLLLSALFWLQKQSLTVKLSNKAKAAGTWQQSNDPGTNWSEESCVSCAQLLRRGDSHCTKQAGCCRAYN